jgi:N-acetyl sugar amidotransferase
MKRCTRCVMPETWPGITFDKEGVCSLCRQAEKKVEIDWAERQRWLREILQEYKEYARSRGNKYDCIVGYSGGKDTAYTLWAAVKKCGMKPLVVTFDHGFPLSPEAEWNLMEIPKKLDCDHLRFTLGNGLRNALCLKGSEVSGDFCWHCHNGVGALPARISKQWDIPLQIWGEPSAEYQTFGAYKYEDLEEQDKEHFEKIFQAGVTPEMVLPPGYGLVDLLPMTWPEGEFPLKAIYLGNYEPWGQREHVEIITRALGWKHYPTEGTYVDWDKVDCPFEPVRDWQKFIKRGLGRTTFQASKDIRDGLMSREEGLRLVEQLDGKRPAALDVFLKEVGMTEEEFEQITRKHIVPRSE